MVEKRIENYWNERSGSYSALVQKEMQCGKKQAWENLLRKNLGDCENLSVVDVGTGPGFFAALLAGMNYSVTAVDKCENMLEEARKNAGMLADRISFLKGEAHTIPLADGSVDAIVSRNVTWILPNPVETYRVWNRLLKPGGKVLIFDANWHLGVSDLSLAAECEKHLRLAMEKGYRSTLTDEQRKENEAISRELPLSYQRRPAWDQTALIECGFSKVEVEDNISTKVHDEMEQILYAPTPMFAICATK